VISPTRLDASEKIFRGTLLAPFETFLGQLRSKISSRERRCATLPGFRPASVLVPLVPRGDLLHITFMQRTEDGRTHSGQIAFPGGAREPTDADEIATALREAQEEVNIDPASVTPLGLLHDNASISHYLVTPVVGCVAEPPDYAPDPAETADIFEVPLPFLLNPANERRVQDVEFGGKQYALYEYNWQERLIWGLTGRILHDFLTLAREVNDAHATFDIE
jgi:8-oxo-dGTP pyrophosphatase MutT (NUDIX family)